MMRDGVGADVQAVGDLVVVQPLGDQAGDGQVGTLTGAGNGGDDRSRR
jgi:hypothetical protein